LEYLDHIAVAIMVKLGDPAERGRLCAPCLMSALSVQRWTLMKSVRALVTAGQILCVFERCSVCRKLELAVSHRRHAVSN